MTNAPTLTRVTSYLSAAEADLLQMQLQAEGIPARLENAALASWAWYYINATGGVKVFVSSTDAGRARAVLWPARQTSQPVAPPWRCKKCEADVDSAWITCWHCGASIEGEEDSAFFEQPAVDQSVWNVSHAAVAVAVGISGPLLFVGSHGSLALLAAWATAVVCVLILQACWRADADGGSQEPDASVVAAIEADATEPAISKEYVRFEDTIRRAWQSAVFSLDFPFLLFYAIWLLVRLDWPSEPCRSRERRRYVAAWALLAAWIMWFIFLNTAFLFARR
jgi:hypothetical protein